MNDRPDSLHEEVKLILVDLIARQRIARQCITHADLCVYRREIPFGRTARYVGALNSSVQLKGPRPRRIVPVTSLELKRHQIAILLPGESVSHLREPSRLEDRRVDQSEEASNLRSGRRHVLANATDHRVGSVDVPFENGRKSDSGASDGSPTPDSPLPFCILFFLLLRFVSRAYE